MTAPPKSITLGIAIPKRRAANSRLTEACDAGEQNLKRIRVNKIVDPQEGQRQYDDDALAGIIETAKVTGLINPIAVRRVRFQRDKKARTKVALVAGAHRLRAAVMLRHKRILCKFVEGDDTFAEQVQIAEDLCRKHLTVLQKSKLLVRWAEIRLKDTVSGQVGQKRMGGRPRSGASQAARELPIDGTVDARRKKLQHATKIMRMDPEVLDAAAANGFDDNQDALLKIAKEPNRKAQLRKIAVLARCSDSDDAKRSTKAADGESEREHTSSNRVPSRAEPKPETKFEHLEAAWRKGLHDLWKYAPFSERQKFITMLNRARCKAKTDVVGLVIDAFRGRKQVLAQHLFAFAENRGISKSTVRKYLREANYRRGREPMGTQRRWFYKNTNRNYKDQIPTIKEHELTGETPISGDEYYLGTAPSVTGPQEIDEYYKGLE